MKRLGAGGRVSGVAAPGGVKCVRTQKGPRPMRLDTDLRVRTHLDMALSLPDGMSPGGRTQNRSLRYNHLERPAYRVSRERQNARYFFC